MKNFSLLFFDKVVEVRFQEKEHKDRIRLLRVYIAIKICISILDITLNFAYGKPSIAFKQGVIGFGCFTTYFLISLHRKITVSILTDFIQITLPIVNLITSGTWSFMSSIPPDNLLVFGAFKAINITTLYMLGTNFRSNRVCFMFAVSLFGYMYLPTKITYNAYNYMAAQVWLIVVKYISDRDRRNQFLLKIKDECWTHIMKDMIQDWVIMITYDSKMNQIAVRDVNQNFQKSCKISDDQEFRQFVRSIKILPYSDRNKNVNIQMDKVEQANFRQANYPNLEQLLRQNLFGQDKTLMMDINRKTFQWNQQLSEDKKIKKYLGQYCHQNILPLLYTPDQRV